MASQLRGIREFALFDPVVFEGAPSFASIGSNSQSAHVLLAFGGFAGKGRSGQREQGRKFDVRSGCLTVFARGGGGETNALISGFSGSPGVCWQARAQKLFSEIGETPNNPVLQEIE